MYFVCLRKIRTKTISVMRKRLHYSYFIIAHLPFFVNIQKKQSLYSFIGISAFSPCLSYSFHEIQNANLYNSPIAFYLALCYNSANGTTKETLSKQGGETVQQEPRITIRTIAKEFGVSESTVSRAFQPDSRISDSVRSQILAYAKKHNYVPNKAAARLSMKELRLGYLCASSSPPYTYGLDELTRGLQAGYEMLHDLKIHFQTAFILYENTGEKIDRLRTILGNWQSMDGIIVCGFYEPEDIRLLNEYADRGIPIVLLQNNEPNIHNLFLSCLDATASSMMAAEFIGTCLRKSETKNVVLFTGNNTFWLHREAETVFRKNERRFGYRLQAVYDMKDSERLLQEQVRDLYETKNLRPDAIFITSGVSGELCEYIKEHRYHEDVLLMTFDVAPRTGKYLRDGVVTATIYQDLYRQAYNAFTGLVNYLVERRAVDTISSPAPVLVLKSNMAYFIK